MSKKKLILSVLGIVVLCIGGYFIFEHLTYVTTDNAQVGAHITMLSSRVNGTIKKVFVEENQKIKAGEVLAQIDTSDYSNASEAAQAQVASLQARYREAELSNKRAGDLFRNQAISQQAHDAAVATFKDVAAKLKASQAQLEQANLNVSYTKIISPMDGTIARKSVEPGQFVPAGQALFGFVSDGERWITANLKETDLDQVHVGSRVEISVDALPKRKFSGEVESISPSTGAIFSLLPPDNATGNFTKVVQRVAVRVKFLDLKPEDYGQMHAGLSADIAIRIR